MRKTLYSAQGFVDAKSGFENNSCLDDRVLPRLARNTELIRKTVMCVCNWCHIYSFEAAKIQKNLHISK